MSHSGSYNHNVVVPSSRDGVIIFPTNKIKGKIDHLIYQPPMTQNRISNEEVVNFLQGIDAFVQPVFKSDLKTLQKWLQPILAIIMSGILIMWMASFFIAISLEIYVRVMLVVIGLAVCGTIFFVVNCLVTKDVKKKIEESKEKIQAYLTRHNGVFQARGYFWVAPANFPYWIELWRATPNQTMPGAMVNTGVNMQQQYMMLPQQQTPHKSVSRVSTEDEL